MNNSHMYGHIEVEELSIILPLSVVIIRTNLKHII